MKKLLTCSLALILCTVPALYCKSSWPTRAEQERMLLHEISKTLHLPASTNSGHLSGLSYDQQVDYFCLMLDLIMDSDCKITHEVLAETFKRYCLEIKKRHPKLYDHFCGTPKSYTGVISYMQKYNGMSDSEIPTKAQDKRKKDRKAFDKKYPYPWSKGAKMKRVAQKFR